MAKSTFIDSLKAEVARIDAAGVAKRHEVTIEGFTSDHGSQATIFRSLPVNVFSASREITNLGSQLK